MTITDNPKYKYGEETVLLEEEAQLRVRWVGHYRLLNGQLRNVFQGINGSVYVKDASDRPIKHPIVLVPSKY